MDRASYIKALEAYYLKGQVSAILLFKYYIENGGMIKDIKEFTRLMSLNNTDLLKSAMQHVIAIRNIEYDIVTLWNTKTNKFIKVL